MLTQTHLSIIDSVYHFRRRIPKDLKAVYAPKLEIKFSLKTKDKRKAEQEARIESVKVDQEFEAHRRLLAKPQAPQVLSNEDITRISQQLAYEVLAENDQHRLAGTLGNQSYTEGLDIANDLFKSSYAEGKPKEIHHLVDQILDQHNLIVAKGSESYDKLTLAVLETGLDVLSKVDQRQSGKPVATPLAPMGVEPKASTKANENTLTDILDKWKLEKKPTDKTVAECLSCITKFTKVNDKLTLDLITKSHVVAYKDERVKDGVKYATIKKHLGFIHLLLAYATDNDYIKINPATGVKVAKPKVSTGDRLPFSTSDLNRIFGHKIFTKHELPPMSGKGKQTDSAGEAAYWIPLLALYTGARPSELCQLTKADIQQDSGYWYLDINNTGLKGIKTNSSKRRVPVHPELIRLGFIEYCNKQSAEIFPSLKVDHTGSRYSKFGDWVNGRFLRKDIGITNTDQDFYSFRHTFTDACRNSGIPLEIHNAFTGHSGGTVGSSTSGKGGYGSGYSLKTLGEWMAKLHYDGLKLG